MSTLFRTRRALLSGLAWVVIAGVFGMTAAPAAAGTRLKPKNTTERASRAPSRAPAVITPRTLKGDPPGDPLIALKLDQLGDPNVGASTIYADSSFRFAAINRFTLAAEQSPFQLREIETQFPSVDPNLAAGWESGDEFTVVVLGDVAATGNPANAQLLATERFTVGATDELRRYSLTTPVSVARGDVYIALVDRRSVPDRGPAYVATETRSNSPGYRRSFYADQSQVQEGSSFTPLSDAEIEAVFVLRGYGISGTGGGPSGGAELVDDSLGAPRDLVAGSDDSAVTLTWTAPEAGTSSAPVAAAEAEPNDSPEEAQRLMLDEGGIALTGSDRSANGKPGVTGGFCTNDGFVDDVEDWFSFTLASGARVTVTLTNFGSTDFDLFLYQGGTGGGEYKHPCQLDGTQVSRHRASSGEAAGVPEFIEVDLPAGEYVIGVAAFDFFGGVPNTQSYKLQILRTARLTGYNVFSSAGPDVEQTTDNFVVRVGPDVRSIRLPGASPSASYAVSAIYGEQQSPLSNSAAGAGCGGSVRIDDVKLVIAHRRESLLIRGVGFQANLVVLLNGKPFDPFAPRVSDGGTKVRQRLPLADGTSLAQNCFSNGCTVTVINPDGSCAIYQLGKR